MGTVGALVVVLGIGVAVWSNQAEAMSHKADVKASIQNTSPLLTSLALASQKVSFPVHAPSSLPSSSVLAHVALVAIATTGINMVEIDYGLPSGTLDIWEGPSTMTVASPNSQSTIIDGLKAQISQWTVGNTNLCSVAYFGEIDHENRKVSTIRIGNERPPEPEITDHRNVTLVVPVYSGFGKTFRIDSPCNARRWA